MYKICSVLLLCFCFQAAIGQQLIFTNSAKNKQVKAGIGNMLFVTYKGYNGQHEFATQLITDITDSTVTLGFNPENFTGNKKYNASANNFKVIYLKDITAFRKRSVSGVALNALISVGGVVGSVFLLNDLFNNNNISTGNAFLISFGAGLVLRFGTQLLFPVNAKYKMADGWSVKGLPALD